jgi:ATP/maltotriose-dependent transcriptional regulator MalT
MLRSELAFDNLVQLLLDLDFLQSGDTEVSEPQLKILRLIAAGFSNREIAGRVAA